MKPSRPCRRRTLAAISTANPLAMPPRSRSSRGCVNCTVCRSASRCTLRYGTSGIDARTRATLRSPGDAEANRILEIVDLVDHRIQLSRQRLHFGLGAAVDGEVEFAAQSILRVLPVLAHHD